MRVGMVASARQCLATSGAISSRERGHGFFGRSNILRLRQVDIEDLAIQKENSCGCLLVGGGLVHAVPWRDW